MHHAPLRMMLLAVLVATFGFAGFGAAPASAAVEIQRVPYSFSYGPETCPALDTTISDTGEYLIRITDRTDSKGVNHRVENATARGTATDADGNSYRYSYRNIAKITSQPGGFPSVARVFDSFTMSGRGGRNNVRVSWVANVTFPSEGAEPIFEFVSTNGNPACDPI